MKGETCENLAKFFYDCGKVSFAVMVIGVLTHKPFEPWDLFWGVLLTLTLAIIGTRINELRMGVEL